MFREKRCFVYICFFLIFGVTGCATVYNPATGRHEVILIDSAQEVQIGRGMAREMTAQEFRPWDNAAEQRRLNEIGRRLASVSDRTDIIYYFQILDDPEYNAFALPGGYVYVFRGLYERMDEGQLNAILAHEIAHVTAKHGVKRLQSALGYQLLVGLALAGLGDKDPRVAEQLSGISGTIYDLVSRGYSRQDELQADGLAVRYLKRAGADPYALARALEFLMNEKGPGGRTFEILSTHPRMEERIKKVKEEIARVDPGAPGTT